MPPVWKVVIGKSVLNEGAPWDSLEQQMQAWCHNTFVLKPILPMDEWIRQAHIAFELIHPFIDGNGRTGRMIMNWHRVLEGMQPLCIKASERQEYYKWFA